MKQIGVELDMNSKRLSLLLAASVMLTGAVALSTGSVTPAQAITSVDELSDVNTSHWAYDALRDLVERYDVIEGYPDHTFRGDRQPTRWELAAALNAVMRAVGRDLARLQAEKANKTDLQTLARLQEEFRNELTALQARTSALEARATAIEAKNEEQDNRLTLLEKTQLHGDFTVGILSDISSSGTGDNRGTLNQDNNNPGGVGGAGSLSGNRPHGIRDGISTIARLRLTMDVPIRDDQEDSNWGRGDLHLRLIGAMGRTGPDLAQAGNDGAFGIYSSYSRIANDRSVGNEGIRNGTTNGGGNTRQNLYIENVHYKQHVKSGVPLLTDWFPGMDVLPEEGWETSGDLFVGVVPWRYLFDKSPYRGNELTQFQNSSLVNTPGIGANYNMPMIAYTWHQGLGSDDLNLDFTTALATIDEGDAMSGLNLSYEGRLNYMSGALVGDGFNMPGSIYVGGYHLWDMGNSSPTNALLGAAGTLNRGGTQYFANIQRNSDNEAASAVYVGWNQEWYEGVGTTFNYLLAQNQRTNVLYTTRNQSASNAANLFATEAIAIGARQTLSGVLHVPMSAVAPGWRDNDVFGIGYAMIDFQEGNMQTTSRVDDAWEKVAEAYYKWQATEAISIVPSLQLIFNRLGVEQNGFTTVLGLRTNYTF
jgi:hypothetical protein